MALYADFDDQLAMRTSQQQQDQGAATQILVNPPSANVGNLGNTVLVSSNGQGQILLGTDPLNINTATGLPAQLFQNVPQIVAVAQWKAPDSQTVPVSILIAPVQQISPQLNPPFGTQNARPYAIINFGTRGALFNAEVDIGTGLQMTVPASMVNLSVGMDTDANPITQTTPVPFIMKLAGELSFWPIVRGVPLTRTVYMDVNGADGTTFYRVPPFAKNVTFMTGSSAAYTITQFSTSLHQTLSAPRNFPMQQTTVVASSLPVTIPLAAGTTRITVAQAAGIDTQPSLLYQLAL